jgi:fucose permease
LGAGSVDAALNNYVALHYKAKHMNWLHCFWGIGASTGPIIISFFLINKNSWNLGYRTIGIIQICLVVILFFSLPLWGKNKSTTPPQADRVCCSHKVFDSGSIPLVPPQGSSAQAGSWVWTLHNESENTQEQNSKKDIKFTEVFRIAGVKQILAAFFCYCAIETTTGLWGSSYLVITRNISPKAASRWISLYYIGITFGRFASGFLTLKLNNRQLVRLGQGLIACGVIALLLPFGTKLLLPGFFMIGLGCAPVFPGLLHETPDNFGNEYSQAIMGIQMACAYIGTMFVPPLFGKMASFLNFDIFPLIIGSILIIKIIMVETVNKK